MQETKGTKTTVMAAVEHKGGSTEKEHTGKVGPETIVKPAEEPKKNDGKSGPETIVKPGEEPKKNNGESGPETIVK
jgi:hypothetical protein